MYEFIEPKPYFCLLICCSANMNNPHPDPLLVSIFAKELNSVKMHPGSCINSHLLLMNLKFQKANLLGIDLSKEQWVRLILYSLPQEYNSFVLYYLLNNPNSSDMDKLETELRAHERNLIAMGPPGIANFNQRKKIKHEGSNKAASSSTIIRHHVLCANCNGKGHKEEQCPRLLDNSNEGDAFVFESCVLENDKSTWIVDSGSTNHVCSSLQLLETWENLHPDELKLKVGNGELVSVKARGTTRIKFNSKKFLLLENVLYIPNFSRNLISVSCL